MKILLNAFLKGFYMHGCPNQDFLIFVGSILSVTVSDRNAPGKTSTFVGICTERGGNGMRSTFVLRNIVDGNGNLNFINE